MVGIHSLFKCPNCNWNGVVDLGITNFVNYNGKELALRDCPKCHKNIAFEIVEKNSNKYFLGNSILNKEGQKMKEKIEEIISNNNDILSKDEESIVFFVIGELQKEFSDNYLYKNKQEIQTILEYILTNNTNPLPISYIFDDIKDNLEFSKTICF